MFDLVNGLPVHPLVVHGVVVLVPLAVLGTIAIALRPAWRRSHGWLVVGVAGAATALIPVATSSGEALARRVGLPAAHAELGETLIWFAIPLLVLALTMVLLERRSGSARVRGARALPRAVAALAVVVALATAVQVYRIGDSGSEAVWGGVASSTG